jgi:His/Glu/Gln/Arg/opine family amino acid ABC transporter permease subunit
MQWSILWDYREALLPGFATTLMLSAISIVGSFALGTAVGCLGEVPDRQVRRLVKLYVELLRNMPIVAEVFVLYFAIGLDALPAAVIALVLHQSAYIADVMAAGFRTIPVEQVEAGLTSGLTRLQVAAYITLPQVVRLVVPPLTNQFIEVIKNSAVVMMIGVPELTFVAQDITADTFRGFEATTAATIGYGALALVVSGAMALLVRKWRGNHIA